MRTPFLLIGIALLAACNENSGEPQAAAAPPPAPAAAAAQVAQAATTDAQTPEAEQADVAAAELTEPEGEGAYDPCDLSGYDLSKMTVDLHEEIVKNCEKSKY